MPERRDHRARAEPDIGGAARQIGDRDERVGRDGEIHPVMLARPDRMHAALVGNLAKRHEFLIKGFVILLSVKPFHMNEEGEFHRAQAFLETG